MRLPTQLFRPNKDVYKNNFGHLLILAGSKRMLGACALTGLSAMRSGCGLVTIGIPESLNSTIQKKISPTIMTLPLKETREQSIALGAWTQIKKELPSYNAIAIGPGLSQNLSTQKFIRKVISEVTAPLVVDADALNALSGHLNLLIKTKTSKILTPHPGEFARLINKNKTFIEKNRAQIVKQLAEKYRSTILLKGNQTLVYARNKEMYINRTGNAGMAKAGSGDVLTGIIGAFLAQGLSDYDAAKFGCYIHGKAGDQAAKQKTKTSMIATDIIEALPKQFRQK